jgi:hypothetical protein
VTGSAAASFGSNVAGVAANQALGLGLVDSDDEYSPHSAFNFFGSLDPAGPGFSSGFQVATYSSSITSLPTASFSFQYASSRMTQPPLLRARSHATNRNDPSAGSRLENPIEIASDSDDEVIEVVQID